MSKIIPALPNKYKRNQRILTDRQIEEAKELLKSNSQRWVAHYFNVSRGTIVRHCVDGMKEYFKRKAREWDELHPEQARERNRKQALRIYHLRSKLFPESMRRYRQIQRNKIGKEYFRIKAQEFRKKHPSYWKRYKQADRATN